MNIENIDKTIAIMQRAAKHNTLFMPYWQSASQRIIPPGIDMVASFEELHPCGNQACLAGHVAVSEEFINDGGGMTAIGAPMLGELAGELALSEWWGVKVVTADNLIYHYCNPEKTNDHKLYGRPWDDVMPDDIIRVLTELKTIGEDAFTEKYDLKE